METFHYYDPYQERPIKIANFYVSRNEFFGNEKDSKGHLNDYEHNEPMVIGVSCCKGKENNPMMKKCVMCEEEYCEKCLVTKETELFCANCDKYEALLENLNEK